MLVLTRQKGEEIMIGDNITIHVIQVKGNKVCIGIDAPEDVEIHRKELWLEIQAERNGQ